MSKLFALALKRAAEKATKGPAKKADSSRDDLRIAARDIKAAMAGDDEDRIVDALKAFNDLARSEE